MPDHSLALTPAERRRYHPQYTVCAEFTMGFDDTMLDQPNRRRPDASAIIPLRAYVFGSECAALRRKHHAVHSGHNHSHLCSCGFVWWHSEKSINCTQCHSCPRCGAVEFTVEKFASRQAEIDFLSHKLSTGNIFEIAIAKLRIRALKEAEQRGDPYDS